MKNKLSHYDSQGRARMGRRFRKVPDQTNRGAIGAGQDEPQGAGGSAGEPERRSLLKWPAWPEWRPTHIGTSPDVFIYFPNRT